MRRFLVHWLTITVALGVCVWILPGVHVSSVEALLVAALVLGFINAVVRPILFILTLPITVLTLGLFYLVINGFGVWLTAELVPGFQVDSLGWAILGALVVSLISWFLGWFGGAGARRDDRDRDA